MRAGVGLRRPGAIPRNSELNAMKKPDGMLEAARISVGHDGFVP
jgi:hypothetical protein